MSIVQAESSLSEIAAPTRPLIIADLARLYLAWCRTYYAKEGRPTDENENIKNVVNLVVEMYGQAPVAAFGPLALKAVRERMIAIDLCRSSINARVGRLKRMFSWGVENELIDVSVFQALKCVGPLRFGKYNVRESVPVGPVADEIINATLPFLHRHARAMVEVQRCTGMRPGEVVLMRRCDIGKVKKVRVYRPHSHKLQHHRRDRNVYLGPMAQKILKPFFKSELNEYIFRPVDVISELRVWQRTTRVSKVQPSQVYRRKPSPKKAPGKRYTRMSYARCIYKAVRQAFPLPPQLSGEELARWKREHWWSSNRLRHTAATALRKEIGIEAARVVLGHTSSAITEIYAEVDSDKAISAMAQMG